MVEGHRSGRWGRVALPLVLAVLTVTYLIKAFDTTSPYGSEVVSVRFFPILIASALLVALAVVAVQELRAPTPADAVPGRDGSRLRDPAKLVLLTAVYVALFVPLGYAPATALYVLGLLHVFGYTDVGWPRRLLAVAGITAIAYVLFEQLFDVRLPPPFGLG